MILSNRGFEYYIYLANQVNYFDLVPELEQQLRTRIRYDEQRKRIVLVAQKESDNRLVKTNYYKTVTGGKPSEWFNCNYNHYVKLSDGDVVDLHLTDNEKTLREHIINFPLIKNNIKEEGWYDVLISC